MINGWHKLGELKSPVPCGILNINISRKLVKIREGEKVRKRKSEEIMGED